MVEKGFTPNLITCEILKRKCYKGRKLADEWWMEKLMPHIQSKKNCMLNHEDEMMEKDHIVADASKTKVLDMLKIT
ncbi:hypothetical protein Sjap_017361 [Stephania japonica]|uniref:Uncharacterized protein n=1 Tax=Stephania japonica TaxID=461633 RepID=A0AAP0NLW9_9MAGN